MDLDCIEDKHLVAFALKRCEAELREAFDNLDEADYAAIVHHVLTSSAPDLAEARQALWAQAEDAVMKAYERHAREHNEELAVWRRYG